MFDLMFIVSAIGDCIGGVKERFEKPIPAENWANKNLYNQDIANGVSVEERIKNARNGKYRDLPVKHEEPHRAADGSIVIENTELYRSDCRQYGWCQIQEWKKQGRYNLPTEEFEKKQKALEERYKRLYSY